MAEQYSIGGLDQPFFSGPEGFEPGCARSHGDRSVLFPGDYRAVGDRGAKTPLWCGTGLAQRSADRLIRERRSIAAGLKSLLPDDGIERLAVAFLRSGHFLTCRVMAEGTLEVVILKSRQIIHAALHYDADQIVIGHNHPSGNVMPSQHDFEATQRLRAIADGVGIDVLDHKIFARDHVFSMKKGSARCIGGN